MCPGFSLLSLSFLMFLTSPVLAQGRQSVPITFEHVAVEPGLPSSVITAILQDRRGFLWLGTSLGIGRFDGYEFYLPADTSSRGGYFVYTMLEDRSGNLWIATIGAGLKKYDLVHETFSLFKHNPADQSSLRSDSVYSMYQDHSGSMWIGTQHGLDRLDSSQQAFTHVFPDTFSDLTQGLSNQVVSICERRSQPGVLWLGMLGGGVARFDVAKGTGKRYLNIPHNTHSLGNNSVRMVYEAQTFPNLLWICTEGGGIIRFDVSGEEFTAFMSDTTAPPRQGFDFVRCMMQDRSGIMWLGTRGGVTRFDPTTGRSVHYENNLGDPSAIVKGHVNAIYEDPSGTHWVATRGGLDRFPSVTERPVLYRHDPSNPLSLSDNALYGLYEDRRGFLWIATWGGGLNRFDPTTEIFVAYRHSPRDPSSLRNDYVRTIYEDKTGTLWTGNAEGVLHQFDVKRGNWKAFTILNDARGEFEKRILSMLEDRDGVFWIGTDEGLYVFDRRTGTHHQITIGGSGSRRVNPRKAMSLYEDSKGALWIGTFQDGLIRYEKQTDSISWFKHDVAQPRSLSHNRVLYIHEDHQGTVWVATGGGGLNRFDPVTQEFTSFTTADGLPDNTVYGFLEDEAGNFWMSTDRGLCRFNPNTKKHRNFDAKDGLQGNEFNTGSLCKSTSGRMFFGGNYGLNAFSPEDIRDNLHIPPLVITMVKSFDEEVKADTGFPYLNAIALPYSKNYISIEFAALDFKDESRNKYAYTLEGLDNGWIPCGDHRLAIYSHLDGGSYIFRVKGCNSDGIWNEEGTSITVIITPPFWATLWFRGAVFVAALVFVGGTIRYVEKRKLMKRIQQLEQERSLEKERSRISQDMHDEVGSSLSEIAILSELAMQKPEESDRRVHEISERAAEVIESVSDIVWAMNPKNDTLDNLIAHVRRYAVKYLGLAQIECRFNGPDPIPANHLSAEVRRNLFLVVKEALHNVVKHSGAAEATMTVHIGEGTVEITIKDNGKGFLIGKDAGSGNGLGNMKNRMNDIGGSFSIESSPGHGTQIHIAAKVYTLGGDQSGRPAVFSDQPDRPS